MRVCLIIDDLSSTTTLPSPPCGVILPLMAGTNSLLDWDKERQQAKKWVDLGYRILWELKLGLFDALLFPIGDQMQFHSLQLAFRHFLATLWQEWSQESLGVLLWRGEAGVWSEPLWNQEEEVSFLEWQQETGLDRSDYIMQRQWDYVHRLTEGVEESAPLHVALALNIPLQKEISWLHPARVAPFILALTSQKLPWDGWHWDPQKRFFQSRPSLENTLGVCLPPLGVSRDASFLQRLEMLFKERISFKLLAEETLLQDLEGIDQILYNPNHITKEGFRKLQGFAAAGGKLIV